MTIMSAVFLALSFASILASGWMMVKKDWLQGCFLAIGAFFCFGGLSMMYSNNPAHAQDAGWAITTGVMVILLTGCSWNFINRVTQRGPYKVNKD